MQNLKQTSAAILSRSAAAIVGLSAVLVSVALLSGCVSVAVEGANVTADKVRSEGYRDEAGAGDPDAQFELGSALCCSGGMASRGVYSTAEAIEWLCKAAEQDQTDAMLKLAQIFEGDQVDGVRVIRRAVTIVGDTPKNRAAAHYWYREAGEHGEPKGADRAADLADELEAYESARAEAYASGDLAEPCTWADLKRDD